MTTNYEQLGKDIVEVSAGEPGKKSYLNYFREVQQKFAQEQKLSGDKA
ncbi:MAG: hypothetical protein F6K18_31960 [Okeania sp. SIO2C2]|nr:hypothetical protein [Okeania sp. SIO2C2]NEP91059.1 hypothetical protein [Okeania sp. SIO2C2]